MTVGIDSRQLIQQIIPIETFGLAIPADEAPLVTSFSPQYACFDRAFNDGENISHCRDRGRNSNVDIPAQE